jgi:hypothetical protein
VLTDAPAGRVIRYHRARRWKDANGKTIRVQVMVVAMPSIAKDEITGIQRTRLSSKGMKIERRMLGVAAGAAVNLDERVTEQLIIGEGVETAMTARQIGLRPTWALGSADAIEGFPVLDEIARLMILAENDEANEDAAETCATRWYDAGRDVFVNLNDALQAMYRVRRSSPGRRFLIARNAHETVHP